MNKDHFELIDRLFVDTSADNILWTKASKPDIGYTSQYVKWSAENPITTNKFLLFNIQHHVDDYKIFEMKIYMVDKAFKTKVLVMEIDQPGIFDFKMKRMIEDLIYLLIKKNKERVNKSIMGPFQKEWNEVVY